MDYPFTTDGCSGGIYRKIFRRDPPWLGCCVEHDLAYWKGGTRHQRAVADGVLRLCVWNRGYPWIAFAMWCAVRIGGHPWWPLPWRWGYGWKYPAGYNKD